MAGRQGGGDLAGGDLQGGEQGGGAVSDVVVAATLGESGLERQDRCGPFQGLDLGLLVDAEHDRVLRRREVQPDDVDDLGDELGIGGEPERLGAPRLDPVVAPGLGHRRIRDPQVAAQQPGRPVRDAELPRRRRQGRGHDRGVVDSAGPARALLVLKSGDALGLIAIPPPDHRWPGRPHQVRDRRVRQPIRGQQDDPGALRKSSSRRRRTGQSAQHVEVTLAQNQCRGRTIRHTSFWPPSNRKAISHAAH